MSSNCFCKMLQSIKRISFKSWFLHKEKCSEINKTIFFKVRIWIYKEKHKCQFSLKKRALFLSCLILLDQPAGAMANTTTSGAAAQEKPKSPASAPRSKARPKKGKGKGKAKPEPPEETDPRKLELIRWVRVCFQMWFNSSKWIMWYNVSLYVPAYRWIHWSRLWWML